ncbi:hypothetical protein GobsT_10990 [Gemmata obscuriglobus]|nr:hypothetical protein [Gemmata obscuriglobus]QEG26360.1 hypothetical protein GobsT_10990 [Gemmata obscuriglobus]VTS01370.1 unnamed protein product [Gemmata obscuriglobus UQM 2246]
MQTPSFTIGGTAVPFKAAWVKLKTRPFQPTGYEVVVPRSLWADVFDWGEDQAESPNLPEFLRSELENLGSMSVRFWLGALSKCSPSPEVRHWEWVIATVDQISEHEDHMRIVGQAERFEPGRFPPLVLRPLE